MQQQVPIWASEIRQISTLEQATKERLLTLLTQFVIQKFSEVSAKEIEEMLQLTPLEETRAVREWMQQAQVSLLSRLIERKFLIPASIASNSLSPLNREALEELAEDILMIQTADELAAWIESHKTNDLPTQ